MTIKDLLPSLLEALRERGNSDEQIARMTPDEAFREYCGWHLGDPGWGVQLLGALRNAEATLPISKDSAS